MSEIKRYSDEDRNTSMHIAAAYGNIEELKKDVDSLNKIDSENYLGWTPLMMAARNGHLEIVKLLIEHRADATKQNHFGASVFLMAAANGCTEMIEFILQHLLTGGVSKQNIEYSLSPISMSILFKHDHIVQYLITKGFNINAANTFTSITPLMYTAVMKNMKIFNHLIANGANLYAKNINQQTAQDIMTLMDQLKQQYAQHCANQSQQQQQLQQQQQQQQPQPPLIQFQQQQPQIISPQVMSYVPMSKTYDLNGHAGNFFNLQPTLLSVPPTCAMRRSSNFQTPHYVLSPSMSPINPPIMQTAQIFFPPDFSPQQCLNPISFYYAHDNSVFDQNIVCTPSPVHGT